MGQEPGEIREEIEQTRVRMTETVGAIGYKTDVGERAKDRLRSVGDRISGASSEVSDSMSRGADRGAEMARSNPLGAGLAGVAAGFLMGWLLPSTRMEDEKLGETSDRVKEAATEIGREAFDRGKHVAQEAAAAAADVVRDEAPAEANQVRDTAQQQVDQIRQ
jgi:ElaB/YqjD/DUF883 family membrane-anchored ribosome-binding protein